METPDLAAVVRALIRANRELTDALERLVGPPDLSSSFVPTDLQQLILAALKGKALRTDSIAAKCDCNRRSLFNDPGGLPELQEEGLVCHHRKVGFWNARFPPPDLPDSLS